MRLIVGVAIVTLWLHPALAQTASAGGSDWFARAISIAALVISVATFGVGRYDKYRERQSAAPARDPVVDIDITRGQVAGNYDYELKVANRGEVSVQLLSLSCDKGAVLKPDDAEVSRNGRTVNYNGLRIERGTQETLIGEIDTEYLQRRPIELVAKLRVNDPIPRGFIARLKRNLP
jgi:hypothetical protein